MISKYSFIEMYNQFPILEWTQTSTTTIITITHRTANHSANHPWSDGLGRVVDLSDNNNMPFPQTHTKQKEVIEEKSP